MPKSQLSTDEGLFNIKMSSVAATGNGGGCVLASATAHVAESQQTLSLYYHPSPAYKQVLYRTIFPTLKGF